MSGKKQSKTLLGMSIIILAGIFLIAGSFINAFSMQFMGAAGWILSPDKRLSSYSLMSLGIFIIINNIGSMILSKSIEDTFGIYFLLICYFIFTVVVPIVLLILLSILWIKPMTIL